MCFVLLVLLRAAGRGGRLAACGAERSLVVLGLTGQVGAVGQHHREGVSEGDVSLRSSRPEDTKARYLYCWSCFERVKLCSTEQTKINRVFILLYIAVDTLWMHWIVGDV